MAIIRLPQTQAIADAPKPVLDNQQRPTVSNRAVASAVNELAQAQRAPEAPMSLAVNGYEAVGRAIQQTGSVLGALYKEKQEAITRKQIGDADAGIAAEKMRHESWKESTQADPMKWEERRAAAMRSFREKTLADESLTGEARQQIITRLDREDGVWKAEDEMRGAKKIFGDVHDMYAADIKRAAIEQNRARWEELRKAGGKYFQEVQKLGQEEEFKHIGEQQQKQAKADSERQEFELAAADAISEPLTWLKENASPWKGRELQWSRIKNIADAREAETTASAVQSLTESIYGNAIKTPLEIDAIDDPALTPEIREKAKELLVRRDAIAEQKDKRENGIRNAVEMRKRVAAYDPKNDTDRTGYFSLVSEIGARVEQSMAGEITGELYKRYGGEPPKLKARPEVLQQISKTLDVTFDAKKGVMPWVSETPVLNAYGRPVKDENGNVKMKTVEDMAKRQLAIDAQADIEIKFNDWVRDNPQDAQDPVKAKKKVMELIPDSQKSTFLDGMQKKLPPLPPLPDTGTTAIKLSNYGYASDTTPDTNSMNGIGHANNKLEDGVSAAVTKSLAVRLGLKTGDWLQLETTRGPMRVRYDDTVPATDKRTGDLPETIDIYRKDGANDWGGKVTGVRKLDSLARM